MDVADLLDAGRRFILIGLVEAKAGSRPIVYNTREGSNYPNPAKIAFFPQIDLSQNIIDLQSAVDIVPDPKIDLCVIERPYDVSYALFNVEVVYGRAARKGRNKIVPSLTLAEVVSQLSNRYETGSDLLFYVSDAAEDCGNLTQAGYHAYRVAVYKAEYLSGDLIPEVSLDGYFSKREALGRG